MPTNSSISKVSLSGASEILKDTTFGPFKKATIKVIVMDEIGTNSNSWFNEIVDYAKEIGMPGIGYFKVNEDMTFKSSLDKFFANKNFRIVLTIM